jgi:hypothetical protein
MKVKTYPKYKKNKKAPKAFVGMATAALGLGKAIYGGIQARKAKKAEKAFDKGRLKMNVSSATQKMADEPISQEYVENLQQQQASDRASAMGALSKDPRNALAGVQALEGQASKQRTALLGMQQDARAAAMGKLGTEQRAVEQQRLGVAGQELAGIRGEKDAAVKNIFGGAEDIASGIGAMAEKGATIDAEEGGVTPDEFDHDTNKIDLVQDGEKIGEATGGELILPPDDVEAVRAALQEGDKDAAFKLMEDLVAKYDENTIEGEDDEAQDGGKVKKVADSTTKTDVYDPAESRAYQNKRLEKIRKAEFNDAFSEARAAGKDTFNFRGKDYTTKLKEEAPKLKGGGYLERVKARVGAYMKTKY